LAEPTARIAPNLSFRLWELYDDYVFRTYAAQPRHILLSAAPRYSPGDVSIVIPTVDTPEALTECLTSQLLNHPHEIVIVTITRDKDRVLKLVGQVNDPDGKIRVLTVKAANKRRQMVCGIQATTGSVLALVDDDTVWPNPAVLPHLLAAFEDATVGGAVGGQV
jgi:cellulose synthase/poly-beta-1,6-N-acetylglucosamine synthase-like glycosyltransferase